MSMVKFIDITRTNFDNLTPKDDTALFFVKETNNTYSLYKGSILVSSNITLPAHSHSISSITNLQSILNDKVDKDGDKGLSTNDYTTAEKNKLTGIAPGAEVNVQSDWNANDSSSDAFIKNKPTLITNSHINNVVSGHNNSTLAHSSLFANKLDKITTPTIDPTIERVYGTDNAGNQKEFNVARFAYDDTIVMRDEIGRILDLVNHNDSEIAHPDIRTALSAKLDKQVILGVGERINVDIVRTGEIQGQTGMPAITMDESNGRIILGSQEGVSVNVANEPTANAHASTKKYVDDKVTTNISNHNTDSNAHLDIRNYVDSKTMTLINSGSTSVLSKTGYRTLIIPTNTYAGKTVAVEIKYGSSSSTAYTNKVIYVTLGTNNSTGSSKTIPRFITLSEWDGEYLKHISVKAYVDSGTTSSIYFGYVKTLIGKFTGSTIDWTTQANDSINVYIGKIWLVG